jgi:serpin B
MNFSKNKVYLFIFSFLVFSYLLAIFIGYKLTLAKEKSNNEDLIDFKLAVNSVNKFSFDLYKFLTNEADDNLFYSPLSISISMAMAYTGSNNNTKKEIANVFYFPLNQEDLHSSFSNLMEKLSTKKEYDLYIANAIWIQKNLDLLPEFINIMKRYYKLSFQEVDYIRNYEQVRKEINNWIYNQTKQKIKDLLKPGDISTLTRLVITNAIYFKSNWKYKFDKDKTSQEDFHLLNGKITKVNMMYQNNSFNYFEDSNIKFLELPYKNEEISMYVILPKDIKKINQIENELNQNKLDYFIRNCVKQRVSVYLPRFRFEKRIVLNDVLKKMGVIDAFDENKADFSKINGKKEFFISKVIHKGFIEVNEEGSEAAAATSIVITETSAPQEIVFKADRPFIFIIYHNKTGCILFMGKLLKP